MARPKRAAAPATTPAATPAVTPDRGRVFSAPKSQQRPLDEALDAKPALFVGVCKEAQSGRTRRIVDFGKSARRYDPRLNSVSVTRVVAIGKSAFAIKPPTGGEGDADAQRITKFVARQFEEQRANVSQLKQHLCHGALEPHAVLEHIWSENARGEITTRPVWRHPNRFCWTEGTGEIAKLDPGVDNQPIPLSTWPDKFVVHAAVGGQSDYPWLRGALRPLLMLSLAGRFGFRWWLSALERFGQSQVYATIREGDQSDPVIAALRALGTDWRAVVPEGTTFNALPVSVQDQLHQRFLDYCNTEKAIGILGQNLSTEVKGGSYAAAKSQERVRADILAADLAELDETITEQWIRPLVIFNFGWGAPVPYIEHTLDTRTPWTLADYQAGLCTADEYRADNGHDPEADGKGKRYSEASAIPASATTVMPSAAAEAPVAAVADTALNGAQVTSLQGLLASIKDGTLAPGAAKIMIAGSFPTFTPEQVSQMVDAQASAAPAQSPTMAPALESQSANAPPDQLLITPGDIWTDTTDGHRIKIVMQVGQKLYLVDLDAENPAQQFSWTVAHFLEICSPPPSAIPAATTDPSGGAAAAAPFPQPTSSGSPTSSTTPAPTNPLRSALLRS